MADDFMERAGRQIEDLQNRRETLLAELSSLDAQLVALYAYVSEEKPEAGQDYRKMFTMVHKGTMQPLRKPRGEQIVVVLESLREALPNGLPGLNRSLKNTSR